MKYLLLLTILTLTSVAAAQSSKGVVVPTSEQGDEVERYDNQPEDLSSEKSETSLPDETDRYEPVKKGIEETPVNIRDAQDFPNNI